MPDKPLVPIKQVCVVDLNQITRMFDEHPSGNKDYDHEKVIARWKEMYGEGQDFSDPVFLKDHGYPPWNVIRDGYRAPSP